MEVTTSSPSLLILPFSCQPVDMSARSPADPAGGQYRLRHKSRLACPHQSLQGLSNLIPYPLCCVHVQAHVHLSIDFVDVLASSSPAPCKGHSDILCMFNTTQDPRLIALTRRTCWTAILLPFPMRLTRSSGSWPGFMQCTLVLRRKHCLLCH